MKHRLHIRNFKAITSRLAGAFGLLLALSLLLASGIPVQADAPPPLPHRFYGDVTMDGIPADTQVVSAEIDGVEVESQPTDTEGHYGYEAAPAFLVSGAAGKTIEFFVAGVKADEATLVNGAVDRLDLAIVTPLTVETNDATQVMPDSVTLNGTLVSMGGAGSVNVSFEWGETVAYGNTTTPEAMAGPGTFFAALTGLTPETTYHFRALAEGSTAYGEDFSFTTPSELAVETNAATAVGQDTATLNGNLTSMGGAATVNVSFEWGETVAYGNTTAIEGKNATGAFSAVINGLAADTEYHFRARAEGSTAYGADMTFTTAATVPPLAVETNAATAVGSDTATLNGNLTSMGGAATVNVSFEWGQTVAYGNTTTVEAQNATGTFSAVLDGLIPATTYHYRAKAEGSTAYGVDMTFATAAAPSGGPALIAPADGSSVSGTSVTYQWSPFPGATRYWIRINNMSTGTVKFKGDIGNVTSYMDTGYSNDGTVYQWRIWPGDAAGWGPVSDVWSFTNTGATAPPVTAATTLIQPGNSDIVSGSSVDFQWSAVPNANKYWLRVTRVSDGTVKFKADLGNVTGYTDTGYPNDGTQYQWKVWAGNELGWGPVSAIWSFTNLPSTPPPAPAGLCPTIPDTVITFNWNATPGATKYWLKVVKVSDDTVFFKGDIGNVTSYALSGFPNDGTMYKWMLWAGNDGGWGPGTAWEYFKNGPP